MYCPICNSGITKNSLLCQNCGASFFGEGALNPREYPAGSVAPASANSSSKSIDSSWTTTHDILVKAILEVGHHPESGAQKIRQILAKKIDVNALDESGRSVLSVANYYEVPSSIKQLLISAGAKDINTGLKSEQPTEPEASDTRRFFWRFFSGLLKALMSMLIGASILFNLVVLHDFKVWNSPSVPGTGYVMMVLVGVVLAIFFCVSIPLAFVSFFFFQSKLAKFSNQGGLLALLSILYYAGGATLPFYTLYVLFK